MSPFANNNIKRKASMSQSLNKDRAKERYVEGKRLTELLDGARVGERGPAGDGVCLSRGSATLHSGVELTEI